jgi:hypothetical protein
MITAPGPGGPPRRKMHWVRNTVLTVITAAAIGVAAGEIISIASGSGPAADPAIATSTFTPSPSATIFTPSPETSAQYEMSLWCAGAGDAALQHVRTDLDLMRAGTAAAAQADGSQLAGDAEAAEKLPPPVTRSQQVSYIEAMGALSFAGADMTAGDLAAAGTAITAADKYLGQDKGILDCSS